jgi:hypothetical protein
MLSGFHPSWTSILFRRSVLDEVGEFDPALGNLVDLDFTLRIASRYPYVIFRKPSGIFRRHSAAGGEFTSAAVMEQFVKMTERLLASSGVDEASKSLIRAELRPMQYKRVMQVAVKDLLRVEPASSRETLRLYHRAYSKTVLSRFLNTLAVIGTVCPPLLLTLRPLEVLRRNAVALRTRIAARRNGVSGLENRDYRATLLDHPGDPSSPLEGSHAILPDKGKLRGNA